MKTVLNVAKTVLNVAKTALNLTRKTAALSLALLLASLATVSAQAAMAPDSDDSEAFFVGEVSLVLGRAWLVAEDASRQPISRGTRIRATDQVLTESGGHVHIRFVDQALVSVRPQSRLEIVRYDYNPEQPQQSTIKLNLQEGVTRAISGKGASAARERFRLNTPIAAIGVRGTDFVVSASQSTVRALVNEGAIIMTPFSADCLATAFGPCALNGIELTSSSLQILELESDTLSPRLLPAPHERDPEQLRDEVELVIANANTATEAEDKTLSTDVYLESVTSRRVTAGAENVRAPGSQPQPQPQPPVVQPAPEFTPAAAVSVAALSERQLVWGRRADGQGAQERITVPFQPARAEREVTVGNSEYILLRTEEDTQRVRPGLGEVSFNLNSAQAFYQANGGTASAMAVNGGSLDINFNRNTFATELQLNHAATGDINLNASGRVLDGGFFNSRSDTEIIAGAVSIDGSEAGFFFEKQLESGGIKGLTLWDKR